MNDIASEYTYIKNNLLTSPYPKIRNIAERALAMKKEITLHVKINFKDDINRDRQKSTISMLDDTIKDFLSGDRDIESCSLKEATNKDTSGITIQDIREVMPNLCFPAFVCKTCKGARYFYEKKGIFSLRNTCTCSGRHNYGQSYEVGVESILLWLQHNNHGLEWLMKQLRHITW